MKLEYLKKMLLKVTYLKASALVALKVEKLSSYAFPEVSNKKTLVFSTLLRATSKISFLNIRFKVKPKICSKGKKCNKP